MFHYEISVLLLLCPFIFAKDRILIETIHVKECEEYQNNSKGEILLGNVTFKDKQVTGNLTYNFWEDTTSNIETTIAFQRCMTQEKPCEKFYSLKIKNYCDILEHPLEISKPYLESFQPRLRCPLQKGSYISRNMTFDLKAMNMIISNALNWRCVMEMKEKDTGRNILCMAAQGKK